MLRRTAILVFVLTFTIWDRLPAQAREAEPVRMRLAAGLGVHMAGGGGLYELGASRGRLAVYFQQAGWINTHERGGEGLTAATDVISSALVSYRPDEETQIALGIGFLNGTRYRTCEGDEPGACSYSEDGVSAHIELGGAPRGKFGVGLRAFAVTSRPLTAVGFAVTFGRH